MEPPELDIRRPQIAGEEVKLSAPKGGEGLTVRAVRMMIDAYFKKYGEEPPNRGGTLERLNRENFQSEYALRVYSRHMSEKAAALAALKAISFGSARILVGYSDLTVTISDPITIDFGTITDRETGQQVFMGQRRVPNAIKVSARRPTIESQ